MLRSLIITVFSIFWAIVLVLTGGRFLALLRHVPQAWQRPLLWCAVWAHYALAAPRAWWRTRRP